MHTVDNTAIYKTTTSTTTTMTMTTMVGHEAKQAVDRHETTRRDIDEYPRVPTRRRAARRLSHPFSARPMSESSARSLRRATDERRHERI